MKIIVDLSEPYLCSIHDPEYGFIEAFKKLSTDQEKYDFYLNFMQNVPHHMMQLADWTFVLNEIDAQLGSLVQMQQVGLLCCPQISPDVSAAEFSAPTLSLSVCIERILILLRFTSSLLKHSAGKDIYNSIEIVLPLLYAYDDDIVLAALDCLVSLLVSPLSHRSEHYLKRHNTSLHKLYSTSPALTKYTDMLFDVIDMAYLRIPLVEFMDAQLTIQHPHLQSVVLDSHVYQKCTSVIQRLQNSHVLIDQTLLNADGDSGMSMESDAANATVISGCVQDDKRSYAEILSTLPPLTPIQTISVLWELRIKKLMRDHHTKQKLLMLLYQSVYVGLNCYPAGTILYNFFTEKIDMMKDFLLLLKLGPEHPLEVPNSPSVTLDFHIYYLSLLCLEATLDVKDFTIPSIFLRFPWLLFELGVSKGQYMGLLPSVLRKYCSAIQRDKENGTLTDTLALKWFEHVLVFVMALLNSPASCLTVLIDNGLISLFLGTIQSAITDADAIITNVNAAQYAATDSFLDVYTLIYEILEHAVIHHSAGSNAFKEHEGVNTVYTALLYELFAHTRVGKRVSTQGNILIEEMFSLLLSYIQEGRPDAADQALQLFYRSKAFIVIFHTVFRFHALFSTSVLMSSLNLIVEIMNRDSMPPTIVNYILQAKDNFQISVLDELLNTVEAANNPNCATLGENFLLRNDLSILHVSFISAISITEVGTSYVASVRYIEKVLNVLSCPYYYLPSSRICMNQELICSLGASLEELIRHFPVYMNAVVDFLLERVSSLSEKLNTIIAANDGSSIGTNNEVLLHYYYLQSYLTLFEFLLVKTPVINYFVTQNGYEVIGSLLPLVVGTSWYRIQFLSTLLDNTIHLMGHTPLRHLILHIFSLCLENSGDNKTILRSLFDYLTLHVNTEVDTLKKKMQAYNALYNQQSASAGVMNTLFTNFLETLSREPIQNYISEDVPLTPQLAMMSDIAKHVILLDLYIDSWGLLVGPKPSQLTVSVRPVFYCLQDVAMVNQAAYTVEMLLQEVFIPLEMEMARAKGSFVNTDNIDSEVGGDQMDVEASVSSFVRVHPVYELLIIADTVVVRETIDDGSKKVLKLQKGSIVKAYERKLVPNNILKYRTDYGWVSIFKNANHLLDAQFLVVDVYSKPLDVIKAESQIAEQTVYRSYKDKLDYEKLTNISLRRAGFLLFFHMFHTVKVNVFMNVTRLCMSKEIYIDGNMGRYHMPDPLLVDAYSHIRQLGVRLMPAVFSVFEVILKESNLSHSAQEKWDTDSELYSMAHALSLTSPAPTLPDDTSSVPSFGESSSSTNIALFRQLETEYFKSNSYLMSESHDTSKCSIPSLSQFSTQKCYHVIRLMELFQTCFFDLSSMLTAGRRSSSSNKNEINYLFFASLLNDKNVHILKTICANFVSAFMCAFDPFAFPEDLVRFVKEDNIVLPVRHELVTDNTTDLDAYKALIPHNTGQPDIVKAYIHYRNRIRERRSLILNNLDIAVDMIKTLYIGLNSSPTTYEKNMYVRLIQQNNDSLPSDASGPSGHGGSFSDAVIPYYDPYLLRRKFVMVMTRYISCLWTTLDPYLFHLHAHHTKLIFELLTSVIKVFQEMKAAPPRLTLSALTRQRPVSMPPGLLVGSGPHTARMPSTMLPHDMDNLEDSIFADAFSGGGQRPGRRANRRLLPVGSSAVPDPAGVAPTFTPQESIVTSLMEMGFDRALVTRAMNALRSNDMETLVAFLLENVYMLEELERTQARSGTQTQTSTSVAVSSSTSNPRASTAVVTSTPAALDGSSTSASSQRSQSVDSVVATPPAPSVQASFILPPMTKRSEDDIRKMRDFGNKVLLFLYNKAILVFLHSIQFGNSYKHMISSEGEESPLISFGSGHSGSLTMYDMDLPLNMKFKRETFTMSILNTMLKVFEKVQASEGVVRLIQLQWLGAHLNSILESPGKYSARYVNYSLQGLLHAMVILLYSKISPSNIVSMPQRNSAVSACELHYLVFAYDNRFNSINERLLAYMETAVGQSAIGQTSNSTVQWLTSAFLLLDTLSHHILLDLDSLRSLLKEVDNINKFNPGLYSELSVLQSTPDSLLSTDVRNEIMRIIGSSDEATANATSRNLLGRLSRAMSGRGDASSNVDSSDVPSDGKLETLPSKDSASSTSAPVIMPFFEGCLSLSQKKMFIRVIVRVLHLQTEKDEGSVKLAVQLNQACYQFLLHLLTTDDLRTEFILLKGPVLLLKNQTLLFDNYLLSLYSLLQRCLEDDDYVYANMVNTIKIIYLRLQKQAQFISPIYLKNLIEICCALVQRDSRMFLKAIDELFDVKSDLGTPMQLTVLLKAAEGAKMDGNAPVEATGNYTSNSASFPLQEGGEAGKDVESSAVKRRKLNDTSSVVVGNLAAVSSPGGIVQSMRSRGNSLVKSKQRTQLSLEVAIEICTSMYKLFMVASYFHAHPAIPVDEARSAASSIISLSDYLVLLADLFSSMPFLLLTLQKLQFTTHDLDQYSININSIKFAGFEEFFGFDSFNVPLKTKSPVTKTMNFITFLVEVIHPFSYRIVTSDKTWELSNYMLGGGSKLSPVLAVIKKLTGENVFNNSCYLLGALLSRVNSLRRDILQSLASSAIDSSSNDLIKLSCFADTISKLLNPPKSWISRDTFIYMLQDIMVSLLSLGYPVHIVNLINNIDISRNGAQGTLTALSNAIEMIFRKGVNVVSKISYNPSLPNSADTSASLSEADKLVAVATDPSITTRVLGNEESMLTLSQAYDNNFMLLSNNQTQPEPVSDDEDEDINMIADGLDDDRAESINNSQEEEHDDDGSQGDATIEEEEEEGDIDASSDDSDEIEHDHDHDHGHHDEDSDEQDGEDENQSDSEDDHGPNNHAGDDEDDDDEDDEDGHGHGHSWNHGHHHDHEDEMDEDGHQPSEGDESVNDEDESVDQADIMDDLGAASWGGIGGGVSGQSGISPVGFNEQVDGDNMANDFDQMLEEMQDEINEENEGDDLDADDEPQSDLQDMLAQSPSNVGLEEDEYSAQEQNMQGILPPRVRIPHGSSGFRGLHHGHGNGGGGSRSRRMSHAFMSGHELSDMLPVPISVIQDIQRQSNALLRSSGGNHNSGSGSLMNNFQDLMSSIIPEGAISSASFARVDANSGTVTLSFSRDAARSGLGNLARRSGSRGGDANIQGLAPSMHPLLAAPNESNTAARRNSLLAAMSTPAIGGRLPLGLYNPMSTQMGGNVTSSYVVNDTGRISRASNHTRRRTMGPIVSDRRWGVDIAENDNFNLRVVALSNNIERYLQQKGNLVESSRPSTGRRRMFDLDFPSSASHAMHYDESKEEGELQETKEDVGDVVAAREPGRSTSLRGDEDLQLRLGRSLRNVPAGSEGRSSSSIPSFSFPPNSFPNISSNSFGSGPLLTFSDIMNRFQSTLNTMNPPSGSRGTETASVAGFATPPQSTQAVPPVDAVLPTANTTISSPQPTMAVESVAAGAPDDHHSDGGDDDDDDGDGDGSDEEGGDEGGEEGSQDNEDWEDIDDDEEGEEDGASGQDEDNMDDGDQQQEEEGQAHSEEAQHMEIQDGPAGESGLAGTVIADPSMYSEDNVDFIATLPPELRQEVLLNSEDSFLVTLPQELIDEAIQYREAQLLSMQFSNYASQPEAPEAAPAVSSAPIAAAAAAPASSSAGVATIASQPAASSASTRVPVPMGSPAPAGSTFASIPLTRTESISATVEVKEQCDGLSVLQEIQKFVQVPFSQQIADYSIVVKNLQIKLSNSGSSSTVTADLPTINVKDYDSVLSCTNPLMYNTMFLTRVMSSIFDVSRLKVSKSLLKLLVVMMKDMTSRKPLVSLMLSVLQGQSKTINSCLQLCLSHIDSKSHVALRKYVLADLQEEMQRFLPAIHPPSGHINVYWLRKFLSLFIYLLKKTDNLVWYTFMEYSMEKSSMLLNSTVQPSQDLQSCVANATLMRKHTLYNLYKTDLTPIKHHSTFFFVFCSMISHYLPSLTTSDVETCLQVIEEMSMQYGKCSVQQANQVYYHTVRRLADSTAVSASSTVAASSNRESITEKPHDASDSAAEDHPVGTLLAQISKSNAKTLPFVILSEQDMQFYVNLMLHIDLSSSSKKRLMRVMRHLSLCNNNWHLVLIHCVYLANKLVESCVEQYQQNYSKLCEASQNPAMCANMQLKTNSLVETRLLTALKMMTILRARSSSVAQTENLVIAHYMMHIQCHNLWDILLKCMDHVRVIEEHHHASHTHIQPQVAAQPNTLSSKHISSYTMQYIPLIECFLSYIGTTLCLKNAFTTQETANISLASIMSVCGGGNESGGADSSYSFQGSVQHIQSTLQANNTYLTTFAEHNQNLLNIILKSNIHLLETSFAPLISHPVCRSVLHFDIKRIYFKNKLKKLKQTSQGQSGGGYLRLHVRREHVFEESFQALRYKTASEMRRRLSVMFHNEEGMDAGGVTREWYQILTQQMFNPNYALFNTIHGNIFQPNPQSHINPDHLAYFKFIGRVVGKAICDGVPLDVHFTRAFYKHILNQPIQYTDLESTDPDYYKSLTMMLSHHVDDLGLDLTFSVEGVQFGQVYTHDLIPNGRNIPVTEENKHLYVKAIAHYRMTHSISAQIEAFKEGFYELVPKDLVNLFDAGELELLSCGLPDIDIDDLRAHTDYYGYTVNDVVITRFWNVLRGFSQEEKALFLQFVTGTSKVPLDGFKSLQGSDGVKQFNIHKVMGGVHMLPTAHTCFNQLDLPQYNTEDSLREKLLTAIREGATGFGFA